MDLVSVLGATASLECAILLLAIVLFQERKAAQRRERLLNNLKATIAAASERNKVSAARAA